MILHVSILTVLLCYTMMFYYVIIVVCSRTSCETAFGWWVILGKYVLIKIKNKNHGIAPWVHSNGYWQCFVLKTARNINFNLKADTASNFQSNWGSFVETSWNKQNSNAKSENSYGPYSMAELPNRMVNIHYLHILYINTAINNVKNRRKFKMKEVMLVTATSGAPFTKTG